MLEVLAKKCRSGDLSIALAERHVSNHEWGLARIAVEQALTKGHLANPGHANQLLKDILRRINACE